MEVSKQEEKDTLDQRNISDLEKAFSLADNIVTKNYINALDIQPIIDPADYLPDFFEKPVSEHVSLFPVKKIVYDRNENNLEKLVNMYAAAAEFDNNLVMIIHSDGKIVELYLGTSGSQSVDSARTSAEALSRMLLGNFPGSLSNGSEDIRLDRQPLESLIDKCIDERFSSVASVSGVGTTRQDTDSENEKYFQGIEKMIDTMQGTPFTGIFIANVIKPEKLEDIRAEYEVLYSKLVPFLRSDLTFNESSAEGVSKTLSKSLSKTVTRSISSALSVGTTKSSSNTLGRAVSNVDGVNVRVGGEKVGVGYAHSVARTDSWSDSTTFGTTKTQATTIGDSEAVGEIESIANGTSKSSTTGRSLQISYQNKSIQDLLELIDEQLNRLKNGENYGLFASAAYFMAEDPLATRLAASSYKGLINGNSTHVESAHVNFWNNEADVKEIKKYLKHLEHPVFSFDEKNQVTPASMVSGKELAVQMGLPCKSVPGVSVVETASFGRNIPECLNGHRYIDLGNLYHMGREENGINGKIPVKLDLDSLTMHTFITGSTGAGKSNAIYTLIEKILDSNHKNSNFPPVTFMVIEPAKGEYKNKFGYYPGVKVYGTNRNKTQLLKINPFSFPDDIQAYEHIDRLVEIFNVCWPMYAAMPAVLKDAIERAYINAGWDLSDSKCKYEDKFGRKIYPSFIDVLKMISIVMEESKYSSDSKGDYTGALSTRIKSLTNGIYSQIFTSDELSGKELFDSNVIVDLSRVGSVETKSLIMGLLVMKMQEYRMANQTETNSHLQHLTVLEEAHNLLKRTSSNQSADSSNLLGKSVEMLANAIAEMRTYGEGFVIADQAPGLLDMSVIRNTNTKIILKLPDMSDRELVGRAAALNDNQIVELSKLETGVAAVYQNNWLEPVLCHIYPCRQDERQYRPKLDQSSQETKLKKNIIDYVMLPAPKKLEVKHDKIRQLEESVYKLPVDVDTKIDLLHFFSEKEPKKIQTLRSHIVYRVFNSETALMLSNADRTDMSSWRNMMLEKLEPNIDTFDQIDQDKILAIIANEHAERVKSPESVELRDDLMNYIVAEKNKG